MLKTFKIHTLKITSKSLSVSLSLSLSLSQVKTLSSLKIRECHTFYHELRKADNDLIK